MQVTLHFSEGFPTRLQAASVARHVAVLGQPETITRGPGGYLATWASGTARRIADPWKDGRALVRIEVGPDARAWAAEWAREQADAARLELDGAKRAVVLADVAYAEALKRANRLEAAAR